MLPAVLSHIPHALIWTGFCLLTPAVLWLTIWLLDTGHDPANETSHESADERERDPEPPLLARRVGASRWHYQPQ